MKKTLSMVLALCLVLCMAGSAMAEGFVQADSYEVGERSYNAGVLTLAPASTTGGSVTYDVWQNADGKDYTDEKVYTFHDFTAGFAAGLDWNPHTWETNDDSAILDYVSMGFYTFRLNSDATGYSVQNEMAAEAPVDVTAEYVGKFGVAEGDSARAWRLALNQDAVWETKQHVNKAGETVTIGGEKITADDYIYSMQQQLNPKMMNRRADSYYAGDFEIVGAKGYLYGGQTAYDLATEADLANVDALYVDMWGFYGLNEALDADGNGCPNYVLATDETLYQDPADGSWVSAKEIYDSYFAPGAAYESYATQYCYTCNAVEKVEWDGVGLVKVDDYTIDIILKQPMEEAAFYLPYNLSSNWLVHKGLYEEAKTFWDADGKEVATEDEAESVTTIYCNNDMNWAISYGPYTLTYYELDKQYVLGRNDSWYGYHDGKHLGMYQCDALSVEVIAEHATAMMAFEAGSIDGVSLQNDDMAKYASSQYIYYTPQTYTTKLSFNTSYEKLLGRGTNSQILVIDEFRQGFALALDRAAFANAYTAAGTAGYGILNYMYCYDPFTGAAYRDTDQAKNVLCNVYGVTYGEGGDYDTLDEAYDAITGYDMEAARAALTVAYEKAVAAGVYDGESPINLEIRVYSSDTVYVQMYNYFNDQLTAACVGTPFEGKVSMTMVADPDYYETNYSGGADMIFTTWGGASMSPFSVLANCYTDDAFGGGNQMEYGYETDKIAMTFDVEGMGEVTDSLQNWSMWARGDDVASLNEKLGRYTDYDYATRSAVFAGMEGCFLNWYTTTPIYYRNVASLHGQKVNFATYQYVNLMGFGGIESYTFNYDDAEWDAYVAQGALVY